MKIKKIDELPEFGDIYAGRFSSWLEQTILVQKTGDSVNVPCGECTACCTSSYFIHIKPDETETISRIPKKLMFPAPGLPKGNLLLGFDEKGHCPMFADKKCSVYSCRPQTCRIYDCRIMTAAGFDPGREKPLISGQVRRWKFIFEDGRDIEMFKAVRAAAQFIRVHAGSFPAGFIPGNIPQQAMVACRIYDFFMDRISGNEKDIQLNPDEWLIEEIIKTYEKSGRSGNN